MANVEPIFPLMILNDDLPEWATCRAEIMAAIETDGNSVLVPAEYVNNKFICHSILDRCPTTKQMVEHMLNEYATAVSIKPLRIIDSWVSKYEQKEFLAAHKHLPKFVSGTIFVQMPGQGGNFYFDSPAQDIDNLSQHEKYTEINAYTTTVHMITPHEGQIVIFKSFMNHGTTPVLSDDIRYTLAFNAEPIE